MNAEQSSSRAVSKQNPDVDEIVRKIVGPEGSIVSYEPFGTKDVMVPLSAAERDKIAPTGSGDSGAGDNGSSGGGSGGGDAPPEVDAYYSLSGEDFPERTADTADVATAVPYIGAAATSMTHIIGKPEGL